MRILLTGGTGFVGSQLLPRLEDNDVYTLERYVTARYAHGFRRNVKTVFADLRDAHVVRGVVREIQPDAVIHLASISPVAYSYEHPQEVIEANFRATVNLAEACLREVPHFRHFLFASTSETYGNGPSPKTEETPQNPNSPYAVSKFAAEKYLLYMREAYGFPITILRPFNTYGRKRDTHFVVEKIIVQMLSRNEVLLGDPHPVRDLLYVDDHVEGYLECLRNERALGQVYNFCTGHGVSIQDLAYQIGELVRFRGKVIWDTIPKRPLDIRVLVGDCSKVQSDLGWTPKVALEEGLLQCVDYWRKQATRADLPSKVLSPT